MTAIAFMVPGKPQGKQRPRLGKGGRVYTPTQTKRYESFVAGAYLVASGGRRRGAYRGGDRSSLSACWCLGERLINLNPKP